MKCVWSNYFALSCDGIVNIFKIMFYKDIPDEFSLGKSKFGYYVTEALGHTSENSCWQILTILTYYSLNFDETTNSADFKEGFYSILVRT